MEMQKLGFKLWKFEALSIFKMFSKISKAESLMWSQFELCHGGVPRKPAPSARQNKQTPCSAAAVTSYSHSRLSRPTEDK